MLCQNCHMPVNVKDTACRSCGAQYPKLNRNWSKFAKVSIVTLVIAVIGAYVVLYSLDMLDFGFIEDMIGGGGASIEAEQPPPADAPDIYVEHTPEPSVEAMPLRRSDEEQQAMLQRVIEAVDSYKRIFEHQQFISHGGYLYNATTSEFVVTELLVRQGFLDDEFMAERVLILYLHIGDLLAFDEVRFSGGAPAAAPRFSVILGYEVPAGIGLLSAEQGAAVIYRESLNAVLAEALPYMGDITHPGGGDEVHGAVVEALLALGYEALDVRYLAVDPRHAFAAVSEPGESHIIRNYILEFDEDRGVTVAERGVERWNQHIVAINNSIPNFNLRLLPDYDILRPTLLPPDSEPLAALVAHLVQGGHMAAGTAPEFIAGNAEFAFIVFEGGAARFAQYDAAEGWGTLAAADWRAARNFLYTFAGAQPPLYILRQE